MKIILNKAFSLFLAVLLLFSFSIGAFASEESAENSDKTAEVLSTEFDLNDDTVAVLSLCTCVYTWPFRGHTWIYVENVSNEPIRVGLYNVPVGEGVSVGTYSFSASDGWGIYYNVEAYRQNRDNGFGNIWSIQKELDAKELEDVSDDIASYLNYWDFYFNCAYFAFSVWNPAAGDFLVPLVLPGISEYEVMMNGGKKGNLKMFWPNPEQVFKQRGYGSGAYLEPVSTDTLNG